MSRPSKNRSVMREMCARLSALLDSMRCSDAEISRLLGYANSATLARMRRGEAFLDSERLARLAAITICGNACANLHWILTGQGSPLLGVGGTKQLEATEILIRRSTEESSLMNSV